MNEQTMHTLNTIVGIIIGYYIPELPAIFTTGKVRFHVIVNILFAFVGGVIAYQIAA